MEIRKYLPPDRKTCLEIFKSNTPLYFAPDEQPLLENWLNGQDENKLVYQTSLVEKFYVTEEKNQVTGCGGYYIKRGEKQANMAWGMVNNALHKKGIGRELLAFRIAEIKKLYPDFAISLDTSQHTFRFFEKLGFTVTQIRNDFYAPGLHRYDMTYKPANNSQNA